LHLPIVRAGPVRAGLRGGPGPRADLGRHARRHRDLEEPTAQGGNGMTSQAIVVEGLSKVFGTFTAVDDVSFEAADGCITALLGPSGSGKSTVLRMIAGLERPTSGRITLAGEDQSSASVQERRVGFVFQHYALFRHMTVRRNVAFGLSVRKEDKAALRERV